MNKPVFKSNEPAINWLTHVLTENVGRNEWVPHSTEEQAVYDEKHPYDKGYPFKVVSHPIPAGTDIVLNGSKEYIIACNNDAIRDMVIGLAERYLYYREQYHILHAEVGVVWQPASEPPDGDGSSIRCRPVIVSSGALSYLACGSHHIGYHDHRTDTWYVVLNGKAIPHAVEQWRKLPPGAGGKTPKYDAVKDEVERLKTLSGMKR